jgi:predicted DNA binding CopG/RHH family protein
MKGKNAKDGKFKIKKRDDVKVQEKHWERAAALYEGADTSIEALSASRSLTTAERRRIFGKSKTKAISIRIPEDDLEAIKKIATATDRGYQQLIVQAIESYIDQIAKHFAG